MPEPGRPVKQPKAATPLGVDLPVRRRHRATVHPATVPVLPRWWLVRGLLESPVGRGGPGCKYEVAVEVDEPGGV